MPKICVDCGCEDAVNDELCDSCWDVNNSSPTISKLTHNKKIELLNIMIDKMKCCANCLHDIDHCVTCFRRDSIPLSRRGKEDMWSLKP